MKSWEVYEQHVYNNDLSPGEGWEPFAAIGTVEHNGLRESLGGCVESSHIIFWRRASGDTCNPSERDPHEHRY